MKSILASLVIAFLVMSAPACGPSAGSSSSSQTCTKEDANCFPCNGVTYCQRNVEYCAYEDATFGRTECKPLGVCEPSTDPCTCLHGQGVRCGGTSHARQSCSGSSTVDAPADGALTCCTAGCCGMC